MNIDRYSRLIHAWVILDLELSLFREVNPLIPLSDLNLPLPDREELFLANDLSSWLEALGATNSDCPKLVEQPSLRTLFQGFLDGKLTGERRRGLTPTTLRLLLYPVHSLVNTFRQLRSCFTTGPTSRSFFPVTRKSTDLRMEEAQALLQRWLSLYKFWFFEQTTSAEEFGPISSSTLATLIIYHVIFLNTVVDFGEMESLARSRLPDTQLRKNAPRLQEKCIQDQEKVVFHAGQIFFLLRSLEKKARPPWWPAALYRVTIILWATSVFYGSSWRSSSLPYVVIDQELRWDYGDEDAMMISVANDSNPPALMNRRDNSEPVLLHDPITTLEACLLPFEDGVTIRFSEGVHRKLRLFLESRYSLRGK